MAKVIIGIHGLGNKPSNDILESWWRSAMIEGLEKHGNADDLPKFELVYWADILYEKPLDASITDKDDPYFIDEKYLPGIADFKPEENSLRQKVLDFIEEQLDKLFLNQDLSVNYSGITDIIIQRYFKDLQVYYSEECLDEKDEKCMARKLIRERLAETIRKYEGEEIMLIAHSMGSIIAYDVLTFMVPDIDIHTFVTIGSPLGFPVIQGKIAAEWQSRRLVPPRLKTPPGVKKRWVNLADLKDRIALIYDLSENYEPNYRGVAAEDFVVFNDYQSNHVSNPHKSYGYLRTAEFAGILTKFSKRQNVIRRLYNRLFNLSEEKLA
jgi:hypothetical protein